MLESSNRAPLQQKPLVSAIFLGRHGLRAGWSCLVFLVLLFLLLSGGTWFSRAVLHLSTDSSHGPLAPHFLITSELFTAACVLLATWLLALLERRSFTSYGLRDRSGLPRFAAGLLCGMFAISALVGLLYQLHLLTLTGPVLHGSAALRDSLLWGLAFLAVACAEEWLLRGYLLFTLARGIGFFWAALLLSVAFGAIHGNNHGETPVGLFSAGAVGLVFCLSIWYTGSLWWAIGFHAAWDWGQSFFWGTSDSGLVVRGHLFNAQPHGDRIVSGGTTGPEGSVYIFAVLLLLAAAIVLYWRRRGPAALSADFSANFPADVFSTSPPHRDSA
jgi:membrane protease YdiL (CAAX protease family)